MNRLKEHLTKRNLGMAGSVLVFAVALGLLALSQMFVIHDHVAEVHKRWPSYAQWAMAGGFEASIITVALAVAITVRRNSGEQWDLAASEVFLIAVSVLAGFIVTYPGELPTWLSTVSMSLVPLQYVCVIFAMRRVYVHFASEPAAAPRRPQERREPQAGAKDSPPPSKPVGAPSRPSGRGRGAEPKMSSADYARVVEQARAEDKLPEAAPPVAVDRIVAEALGVSPKTAYRHRPNGKH